MKTLGTMGIELLCHLTFRPAEGVDPNDTAELTNAWWQTLIHDLDADELKLAKEIVAGFVADLAARQARSPLARHDHEMLVALEGFLSGDLS